MSASEHEQPAKPGGQERPPGDVPNEETGVGLGADEEANSFEPEEDPDAVEPE